MKKYAAEEHFAAAAATTPVLGPPHQEQEHPPMLQEPAIAASLCAAEKSCVPSVNTSEHVKTHLGSERNCRKALNVPQSPIAVLLKDYCSMKYCKVCIHSMKNISLNHRRQTLFCEFVTEFVFH